MHAASGDRPREVCRCADFGKDQCLRAAPQEGLRHPQILLRRPASRREQDATSGLGEPPLARGQDIGNKRIGKGLHHDADQPGAARGERSRGGVRPHNRRAARPDARAQLAVGPSPANARRRRSGNAEARQRLATLLIEAALTSDSDAFMGQLLGREIGALIDYGNRLQQTIPDTLL